MQVRPRHGKHQSTATPARDRKPPGPNPPPLPLTLHRHGARRPRHRAARALRPLPVARQLPPPAAVGAALLRPALWDAARARHTFWEPQRPQRRTARAAAQPFISHPLRAPQHEWRRTSSTRVAADFLNARRKPAKGPRPRMKTFGNWVHILVIKWQVRFAKFLEMFYFSPSYLFSRVDKR